MHLVPVIVWVCHQVRRKGFNSIHITQMLSLMALRGAWPCLRAHMAGFASQSPICPSLDNIAIAKIRSAASEWYVWEADKCIFCVCMSACVC